MKKRLISGMVVIVFSVSMLWIKNYDGSTDSINEAQAAEKSDKSLEEEVETVASTNNESKEKKETLVQVGSEDALLYSAESKTGSVISEVNRGELLTINNTEEEWYKVVTTTGEEGYLAKEEGQLVERTVQEKPTSLEEAVIVLNPGHGGEDTGALSNSELIYEKDVTLATAKIVKEALEAQGSTVILTREEDQTESLDDIVEMSNEQAADIFISLHYDSTENMNEATGTTTYYYYEEYASLAESINDALAQTLALENRGLEYGNFQVLRENLQPALLLELGYMNSDYDVAMFNTKNYQEAVAKAIVSGLSNYFQEM